MFDMGELLVIFIVALLVFGPKRLPELARALGRAMSELKRASLEFRDNLEAETGAREIKEDLLRQQKELQAQLTSKSGPAEGETKENFKNHAG